MRKKGNKMPPAVCLLSGGVDSTTALAIARADGFRPHALSFRYGQRNIHELEAAQGITRVMHAARHLILDIDLGSIGGSALTSDIPVPKDRPDAENDEAIPVTYVPGRNIIFLSLALSWAESIASSDIYIGVNAVDYSGYPDCRPEFIRAFEKAANLGTKAGTQGRPFRIHTPLIDMTKAQIIRKGMELGVDYSLTRSCYDPDADGKACGRCDSCLLRKKGFQEAGVPDPTEYAS